MGEIKVTDRRMFTPDGRVREQYERELAETALLPDTEPAPPPEPAPEAEPVPAPGPPPATTQAGAAAPGGTVAVLPAKPPPGMLELVDFLAQLALAAMGEVPLADGRLVSDLDGARYYIDLIGAFHERYAKQLSAQELHFLESYLDQLRLRYVARRG